MRQVLIYLKTFELWYNKGKECKGKVPVLENGSEHASTLEYMYSKYSRAQYFFPGPVFSAKNPHTYYSGSALK